MSSGEESILELLQTNPKRVRNICILAHVDHGKTTLADSLVASNGIISQRMAGQLRYMDTRKDEQERGITMKSSGISLHYKSGPQQWDYLINLIDSPGHVDFSSEVSTAVRLCDGAILVVDVIEGVCAQTRACLQQVYVEQLKPVLLLNKIDRLILEKQMTPMDAYVHIMQIVEQVNAVLGSIFASDVLAKEDISGKDNYESALEQSDDSTLYFQPCNGNVVFGCAIDGWAFCVQDFAKIYAPVLDMPEEQLATALGGDYYYNVRNKCATLGAQAKSKKPMFVQFILENIWSLYDIVVVRKDKERIPAIAEKLKIKLMPRDLRITDAKVQMRVIMSQWLPVATCVLELVVRHVPPPDAMTRERAERLLFPISAKLDEYPEKTRQLLADFESCDARSEHVIAYVAKMIAIPVSQLPQKPIEVCSEQNLLERREEVLRRVKERQLAKKMEELADGMKMVDIKTQSSSEEQAEAPKDECEQHAFVAFARIFSGKLKAGDKIYILSPKHDPRLLEHLSSDAPYVTEVTVGNLYMLMGSELQVLHEAFAGNFVAIGGLAEHVVKTATLCSSYYCTSFSELSIMATPIYRVAIEPVDPYQMPQLIKGLKLLNQADACVQISVSPKGERIISTLGEVHVEKCVRDLEESYAGIKVNVSSPIVPFRETIVSESTLDMVNEAILKTASDRDISKKIITIQTTNKLCELRVLALPLPTAVVDIIERHSNFFKEINQAHTAGISASDKQLAILARAKLQMQTAFEEFDVKLLPNAENMSAEQLVECIWALGPRHCGSNILLNLSDFVHISYWNANVRSPGHDIRNEYANSLVNGFQVTAAAGPLCEEPMYGVCFVVLEWTVNSKEELNTKAFGPFSGQLLNAAKDACRLAFQQQPMRLVSPMYSCSITVDVEMLGKMYAVIGRRHGKILSGDLTHGSGMFTVEAVLPVIESFNFAQEIRKQTSGLACPQLVFSHWAVIEIDPFWVPTTDEEITHYGEKADSANRAKLYMDSVRRRKGLHVDEQIVEYAEKQRTLSKNK